MSQPFRSGFAAIVGRPNVGKSTLTNRLVGKPISITANKPQTTRNRVMGVLHGPNWQAVLLDTPGIHQAADALNRRMVSYALAALKDADVIVMVVEPFAAKFHEPGPQDTLVLEVVTQAKAPALLLVNKADANPPEDVARTMAWYQATGRFDQVMPLSALKNVGLPALKDALAGYLKEGPSFFPEDQTTDQDERQLISEFIRQEIFRRTQKEVPYATAVRVDTLTEDDKLMRVLATVLVERDSQKGILIGKGGAMMKAIGSGARLKLESLFGVHIHLELHVKVQEAWSQSARHLDEMGYPEV